MTIVTTLHTEWPEFDSQRRYRYVPSPHLSHPLWGPPCPYPMGTVGPVPGYTVRDTKLITVSGVPPTICNVQNTQWSSNSVRKLWMSSYTSISPHSLTRCSSTRRTKCSARQWTYWTRTNAMNSSAHSLLFNMYGRHCYSSSLGYRHAQVYCWDRETGFVAP